MEKTIHFGRRPYEAPETEELEMVERWDILQYPDPNIKPVDEDPWGDY